MRVQKIMGKAPGLRIVPQHLKISYVLSHLKFCVFEPKPTKPFRVFGSWNPMQFLLLFVVVLELIYPARLKPNFVFFNIIK